MNKKITASVLVAIALISAGALTAHAAPAKKILTPQERAQQVGTITLFSKDPKSDVVEKEKYMVGETRRIVVIAEKIELITIAASNEAAFKSVSAPGTKNGPGTYEVLHNQTDGKASSIQYKAVGTDSFDGAYRIAKFAPKITFVTTVTFTKPGRNVITIQAMGIGGNRVEKTLVTDVYDKATATLSTKTTSLSKKGDCASLSWTSNGEVVSFNGKVLQQAGANDAYSSRKTGVKKFCPSTLPYTAMLTGDNPVSSANASVTFTLAPPVIQPSPTVSTPPPYPVHLEVRSNTAYQQNTSDANDEGTFWDQRLRFITMLGKSGDIEFGFTTDAVGHIAGLENGLTQSPFSSGEYGIGGGLGGVLRGKDWELVGAIHVNANPADGAFLGPRVDVDFTKTMQLGSADFRMQSRATTDFGQYSMAHTLGYRLPFPGMEKDKLISVWLTAGTHTNGTFDGTPGITGLAGLEFGFFGGRVRVAPMVAFDGEKVMPALRASMTIFNFGNDFRDNTDPVDYHSQN